MDTLREAMKLLERERVMTLVAVAGSDRRALVSEVAGGPVRGSWWAHPRGKLIYRIAEELEASGVVLVCKLVAGKVTFVHRGVWPELLRVTTDAAWRKEAERGLARPARELLEEVEAAGVVRGGGGDGAKVDGEARKALEARHLVVSASEHGERGAHVAVLKSWRAWAGEVGARAAGGSLAESGAALAAVGVEIV